MSKFIPVEPEKWAAMVRAWADNSRLQAEVERLTAFTTRTIIPNEELQAENARLKAEVERLTKELENTDCMFAMASAFARDWNAAKEGKQP